MRPEWEPEWVVTPEEARVLIQEAWPELWPVSVKELGAGWDNTVFLINNSIVFRFPRRKIAVPLIENEIRLLPWLGPQLPLEIPDPRFVGKPHAQYPCPFAGYRRIPGSTLTETAVSDAQRSALAKPLAGFLRALHSVDPEQAKAHGAPEDTMDRLNIEKRRAKTRKRLDTLVTSGLIMDRQPIDDLLEMLPAVDRPATNTLVHGDLHASQLLVTANGELCGVIDWGDVHLGDPAVDFAAVHAIVPKNAHGDFLETYGPVDARTWDAARGRALWHTIAVLAQAADVRDSLTIREAQSCLGRLVGA